MDPHRQKEDLLSQLREQIYFLNTAANNFDEGIEFEYKRLTVPIRTLIHDTKNTTSLLTQLNKKNIMFLDTATPYNPKNLLSINCLTMIRMSPKGTGYVAPLDNLSSARLNKKIPFEKWWERNIIYKDNSKNTFTRSKLVLDVADKDGGVHIDSKLPYDYVLLAMHNSLGWKAIKGDTSLVLGNPVPASIRQIAHEVLLTLKDEFPLLFD